MSIKIQVQCLDESVPLLARAYPGDAGFDLHATIDIVLAPFERALVPTGIKLAMPDGYAGFVLPRSGLALRLGLTLANTPGLIDSQYRGEVQLIAVNLDAHEPLTIQRGERVAQLVILALPAVEIEVCDELDSTQRGEGGFGSSGV